jgi:transcriptional regulator with XRE-family HTH domain
MTAYVRVRKLSDLVEAVDATGTQVDVAIAAGLSVQRLNQLYTGRHDTVEVRKARRLEQALGTPPGALFVAVDGDLLGPYVHADQADPEAAGDPAAPTPDREAYAPPAADASAA